MKGLYGFNLALLIITSIGWLYTYRQLQELRQNIPEQLKAERRQAYYQCMEEAEKQFKEDLYLAERTARQDGYNKASSECDQKLKKVGRERYQDGQKAAELIFQRQAIQMEHRHNEEILALETEHQKEKQNLERTIIQLKWIIERNATNRITPAQTDRVKQKRSADKSAKNTTLSFVSPRQMSRNILVGLGMIALPFLGAMIMGIVRK